MKYHTQFLRECAIGVEKGRRRVRVIKQLLMINVNILKTDTIILTMKFAKEYFTFRSIASDNHIIKKLT